jgi:putative ABC transport system permease protein
MDTFRHDVAYALRTLMRSPGITMAAVLCLALGIGATTTVYSATRALVLNPVPVKNASRVVRVSELPPNSPLGTDGSSPATLLDWQTRLRSFERVAGFNWVQVNLIGAGEPERVSANRVSPDLFSILSTAPMLGRTLVTADAEAGGARVVVLSFGLWQRQFAGARDVVGKFVRIDGESHEIVGVMPREFVFPPASELWLPLTFNAAQQQDRVSNSLSAIALLKRGVPLAQARAEVAALEQRITEQVGERKDWTSIVEPVQRFYSRNPRPYMFVALIAVTLVLLIGCANVANLLLARGTGRGRELAVRTALGASKTRVFRMLLTESAVLAFAGGVGGVLLALWGVLLFRNSIPAELVKFNPGWTAIRIDPATLGFALLAALLSSLISGVLPALQTLKSDLQDALRDGARGTAGQRASNRTRNALVLAEIALAVTLVVSTGLTLRSFKSLLDADLGFRRENILTMQIALPTKYDDNTREKRALFYDELNTRLTRLPGVRSVALVNVLPMDWNDAATRAVDRARVNAPEGEQPVTRMRTVSDSYFATMQIPLLRGRYFDERDRIGSPLVAIVSEQFARQLWPNEEAIGKQVRILGDTAWREVVGVVADTRHNPNVGAQVQPMLHFPMRQRAPALMTIVLRTAGEPTQITAAAQREIGAMDIALAAGDVRTLDRVIYNALAPQRSTAGMLGVFGTIALVLACVGVYGVMSYSVARRASEIGVRIALGARSSDVLRLVMRYGATLTGVGLAIGLVGALALSRAMKAVMPGAPAADPLAFLAGTVLLTATALLACYIPARRAAATDATALLRRE